MKNIFENLLNKMNFGDNDEDDDDQMYDDYNDSDEEEEVPKSKFIKKEKPQNTFKTSEPKEDEEEDSVKPITKPNRFGRAAKQSKSTSDSKIVRMGGSTRMEVCVIKPLHENDEREIATTLLNGKAVIINLDGLDIAFAQRIVDFVSGACFAIDGTLQKVTSYILIATPSSIDLSGDLLDMISTEGSSLQDFTL